MLAQCVSTAMMCLGTDHHSVARKCPEWSEAGRVWAANIYLSEIHHGQSASEEFLKTCASPFTHPVTEVKDIQSKTKKNYPCTLKVSKDILPQNLLIRKVLEFELINGVGVGQKVQKVFYTAIVILASMLIFKN